MLSVTKGREEMGATWEIGKEAGMRWTGMAPRKWRPQGRMEE